MEHHTWIDIAENARHSSAINITEQGEMSKGYIEKELLSFCTSNNLDTFFDVPQEWHQLATGRSRETQRGRT